MRIDGPVVAEEVIAPNVRKELVSGERDIPVFHQIEEQIVFLRCQFNLLAVNGDGSCRDIDFQTVKFHNLRLRLRGGFSSGKHRVDSGHQLLRAEWFDDIVVDPQLETEQFVIFLPSGRKHDDRNIFDFLYLLAGGKPVQLRHHDIHDDQIIIIQLAKTDCGDAVIRLGNFVTAEFSVFLDDLSNFRLVIYH